MSKFIVKESKACMPSSCRYGDYRKIAVLEVGDTVSSVAMISNRAIGVIEVVQVWDRVCDGKTSRAAANIARMEAKELAEELNGMLK